MQVYIANLSEKLELQKIIEKKYIVYFAGCNFNCPYCNSSLLNFKNELTCLLKDLKKEINNLQIEEIVFTGGEPCLQRQALLELCRFAKTKKIKTTLETNGSKPDAIKSLIKSELIDKICLDIKAPLTGELFEKITKSQTFFKKSEEIMKDVKESISILEKSNIEIEIKIIITPSLLFKKEDILEIINNIKNLNCIVELIPFKPEECPIKSNLRNISPPTTKFIQTLKEATLKKYPHIKFLNNE